MKPKRLPPNELKSAEAVLKAAKDLILRLDSEIAEAKAQKKILKETLKRDFELTSVEAAEKMLEKLKVDYNTVMSGLKEAEENLAKILEELEG